MTGILYALNVLLATAQSATSKSVKPSQSKDVFNLIKSGFSALIFGVLALIYGKVSANALIFGCAYGVLLFFASYCGIEALTIGPMALTSVIASFSLVIPLAFGFFVFGEPITALGIAGIILLVPSFILMNKKEKKQRNISAKWLVFTLLTALSNGFCSVFQMLYGKTDKENLFFLFMFAACFSSAVIFFFLYVKRRKVKTPCKDIPLYLKGSFAGFANGGANCITLYLTSLQNATALFPIVSVCTAVCTLLCGRFYFKERLGILQLVGVLAGIASVLIIKLQ